MLSDAESEYRRMIARLGVTGTRWFDRLYVVKVVGRMLPSAVMRLLRLHRLIGLLGL